MKPVQVIQILWGLCCGGAVAQDAETVLRRADEILSPPAFVAQLRMLIQEGPDKQRSYEIEMSKSGKKLAYLYFNAPTAEKGRKILRRDDAMWMLLPITKKVIRVSPKQNLLNGDFSFADLTRLDFLEDYQIDSMNSENDVFVLKLTAKSRTITYDRVEYKIAKQSFMPIEIQYLSVTGKVLKKLSFQKPQLYGRLTRPSVFFMQDSLQPSQTTTLVFENLDVQKSLADSLFDHARL